MKKIVFLLICVILVAGCSVKKVEELSEAEKFAAEFSISENNPFEYATIDQILNIFNNGDGIIFFGNSDDEWCVESIEIFNDALEYKNVSKVYYYNPITIQNKNTKKYRELIELVKEYSKDEEGKISLDTPEIYVIKGGKIVDHSNCNIDELTSKNEESEVTELDAKELLRDEYLDLINSYVIKECTGKC